MVVITTEQMCVKREMEEGLAVVVPPSEEEEEMEMGALLRRD